MPLWDLLNFLAEEAAREQSFTLLMDTTVTGLLREGGKAVGVRCGDLDLRADLTVACNWRHATIRRELGPAVREFPVPFDIWWFRLPHHPEKRDEIARLNGESKADQIALSFTREDYYQIAYFTKKRADPQLRAEGTERLREPIAALLSQFADRVDHLRSLAELHLLDVKLLHRAMFVPAFSGTGARSPRPLVFLARYFPSFKKIPSKLLAFVPRPKHAPAYARRAEQRS